jgi:hypothetical protein
VLDVRGSLYDGAMRRALAPAFVTTVLACNKTPLSETPPDVTMTRNPPPVMLEDDASAPPVTAVDSGASETNATATDASAPRDASASIGTHRKRKRTAPPITGSAPETAPSQLRAPLNPTDGKGRLIYALADDRCVVEVPYQGPPRQLPRGLSPRSFEEVDCPPAMDDAAWDNCSARLSFDEASSKCLCVNGYGNPPPPPRVVPCPADVKAGGKKAPPG